MAATIDERERQWIYEQVVRSMLDEGELTERDLKSPTALMRRIGERLDRTKLQFVVDHRQNVLDLAKEATDQSDYELAIMYYGLFFEHQINSIIDDVLSARRLGPKTAIEVIRNVNLRGKLTWLPDILGLPALSSHHKKTIVDVTEARNGYVHYKYTAVSENPLRDEERDSARLLGNAAKAASYLRRYEARLIWNGQKANVQKAVRRVNEMLRVLGIDDLEEPIPDTESTVNGHSH